MTLRETEDFLRTYFNFDLGFDSDIENIHLCLLIGKNRVYTGVYVWLDDGISNGNISINLESLNYWITGKSFNIYEKYINSFPKYLFCRDNLRKGLKLKEAEELILNYLLDFKKSFEETINSYGCMLYTKMYIYNDYKKFLIPIKEE